MALPLTSIRDVGRSGRLNICFSPLRGRTVLGHLYQETPFKITRLHYRRDSSLARVIVMQSTAGLFGGDRLEARFHVERGARVLLTSQAATKVHPSCGLPASQLVRISVEDGGELHYYVDPLIPFADSNLRQKISIELGSKARFYYWDGLMAGRVKRGEQWRFSELISETSLFVDAKLAFIDRFQLCPSQDSPSRQWRMGRHSYMATGMAHDPSIDENYLERFRAKLGPTDLDLVYGLDIPYQRLMVGRFLSGDGTSFREISKRYQSTILQGVQEESIFSF